MTYGVMGRGMMGVAIEEGIMGALGLGCGREVRVRVCVWVRVCFSSSLYYHAGS
jgi:hypothetical protein